MDWSHTSLGGLLRHQIEVELLSTLVVLDELGVNNTTWLRILSFTVPSSNKHSLVDSLVDDYQSDGWWTTDLVVEWLESFLELANFLINDLVSHLSANTIPIDNNLSWLFSMITLEGFDCLDQAAIEILLYKFLVLGLDDDVRVVRGLMLICRSAKSNDTLLSSVTHINSNNHDLLLVHELRHFHSERLSSNFRVNLLHDV